MTLPKEGKVFYIINLAKTVRNGMSYDFEKCKSGCISPLSAALIAAR